MTSNEFKSILIHDLKEMFGTADVARRDLVSYLERKASTDSNYRSAQRCLMILKEYVAQRGIYNFDETLVKNVESNSTFESKVSIKATSNLSPESLSTDDFEDTGVVPENDPLFVGFGFHSKLKKILSSEIFYPIFITGLSGNGKTKSVQQACAELKRKLYRVNITVETDEDDLIGGFRLKDGSTVFEYGPAIQAMKEGAVLLLDEIDLASNKIMCLQSILEGSSYHIKKTGEHVKPAHGFTIVATANTKGKGSDDGRFIGTNIMNEAFLERFVITVDQEYPSEKIEKSILIKLFKKFDINDDDFADKLVKWAKLIREGFLNGSIDELITTRRLVHIAKTYAIFANKMESIKYCLNRFDDDTQSIFLDSYTKIDASVDQPTEVPEVTEPAPPSHPF